MRVNDLKNYIENHVVFDFVLNRFHAETEHNTCVVVLDSAGDSTRNVANLRFQFLVRSNDPEESEAKAFEIFEYFNRKTDYLIGDSKIVFSKGEQAVPLYIGMDENKRTIYSVNIVSLVDKN
jgi:hypothetical protein